MPKNPLLNGIKSYRTYEIEEAANVTKVSVRTVRNWIKYGLPILGSSRPILIRGDDLRDFLKKQRASRKVKVGANEFYCCACRQARKAAGGFADCTIIGKRVTLKALCETCETIVSKPISEARISEICTSIELTITRQKQTL